VSCFGLADSRRSLDTYSPTQRHQCQHSSLLQRFPFIPFSFYPSASHFGRRPTFGHIGALCSSSQRPRTVIGPILGRSTSEKVGISSAGDSAPSRSWDTVTSDPRQCLGCLLALSAGLAHQCFLLCCLACLSPCLSFFNVSSFLNVSFPSLAPCLSLLQCLVLYLSFIVTSIFLSPSSLPPLLPSSFHHVHSRSRSQPAHRLT
jgi:hypothetical protein